MSDPEFELVSLGDESAEVCVDGYCEIPEFSSTASRETPRTSVEGITRD
jgi:hypothetical protein